MSHVENNVTVEVTLPENVEAGDTITVHCPDNSYVEFVAPPDVASGDTVHVLVDGCKVDEGSRDVSSVSVDISKASYRGVAAVTTVRKTLIVNPTSAIFNECHFLFLIQGVLVSALVIGPVVTGIFVVGMVVCAAQKGKTQSTLNPNNTAEESVEEGAAGQETADTEQENAPRSERSEPETREEKIAAAFVRTADYIADKWGAIDDRFAISSNTLKALATVQEMDERNKISETVVTKIKDFDEKYHVSEKAGNAVTATVTKVHELDATCKISENAFIAGNNIAIAGSSAVTCVGDFERRYEITTRITTALIFAMSTLSDALTVYMRRITNSAPTEVAPSAVIGAELNADIDLEGGHNGEEEGEEDLTLPEVPSHPVQRYASYAEAVQAEQPPQSYTLDDPAVEPTSSIELRSVEIPV